MELRYLHLVSMKQLLIVAVLVSCTTSYPNQNGKMKINVLSAENVITNNASIEKLQELSLSDVVAVEDVQAPLGTIDDPSAFSEKITAANMNHKEESTTAFSAHPIDSNIEIDINKTLLLPGIETNNDGTIFSENNAFASNPTSTDDQGSSFISPTSTLIEDQYSSLKDRIFPIIASQFPLPLKTPNVSEVAAANLKHYGSVNDHNFQSALPLRNQITQINRLLNTNRAPIYNQRQFSNFPIQHNPYHAIMQHGDPVRHRVIKHNSMQSNFPLYTGPDALPFVYNDLNKYAHINDYYNTELTNENFNSPRSINDALYPGDIPLISENENHRPLTNKIITDIPNPSIKDISEDANNLVSATEHPNNHIRGQNVIVGNKLTSPAMPTYYMPVGRILIYEVYKPYFEQLQNAYKSRNINLYLPQSYSTNYGYQRRIREVDQGEYVSSDKQRPLEKKENTKTEKRNADGKAHETRDSFINQKEYSPHDQYQSEVRRHDVAISPFPHKARYHNHRGIFPNSRNLYGYNNRANRTPPHGYYEGTTHGRELKYIMYNVFGI